MHWTSQPIRQPFTVIRSLVVQYTHDFISPHCEKLLSTILFIRSELWFRSESSNSADERKSGENTHLLSIVGEESSTLQKRISDSRQLED